MNKGSQTLRAIDLYAGMGGWSLGLRLAGIDVVASYEWWQPAIDTHNANLGVNLNATDIRKLALDELPQNIDIVVGSPPCTEFSYANRGGSGDLAEGMKDLVKFFEIVDALKPKFWMMENVPRVEQVIRLGMQKKGHPLYRFRHLDPEVRVVDFSVYGTPQARKRCIATNLDFEHIAALAERIPSRTLGDVVRSFAGGAEVRDPVWGVSLAASDLTDMEAEPPLGGEELRMNREAKAHHPVYNNMAFPDPLDRPSRTVTATCTRVSRESIVISDLLKPTEVRRLTIRERASLQGFPITYQFYGKTFSEKAKLIGNAIPPTFTYVAGLAMSGVGCEEFSGLTKMAEHLSLPTKKAPVTAPENVGRAYSHKRGFRSALSGFRFKSGMRFELSNRTSSGGVEWTVRFFFGPSKDIREIDLDGSVSKDLHRNKLIGDVLGDFQHELATACGRLGATSPHRLQLAWTKKEAGMGPFEVTDILAGLAESLHTKITSTVPPEEVRAVSDYVLAIANSDIDAKPVNGRKLEKNALRVLAGIVVGEWFNSLDWHFEARAAA